MNPNDFVTISDTSTIGLPGCAYIYAPAGQAGEYAPLAANPYRGCPVPVVQVHANQYRRTNDENSPRAHRY